MPSDSVIERAPAHQVRAADRLPVKSLKDAVVHRQHVVLDGLLQEQRLQLGKLLRVLRSQVVDEAEIRTHVIELPSRIVFQGPAWLGFPGRAVDRAREPAFMVDGTVAGDLEVLRRMPLLRLAVVEAVDEARALDRDLLDAVDDLRLRQARGLQDRRRDVDHVAELRTDLVLRLDALGPGDDHAVARAAEIRRDLLHPAERRVERHRPARRHVRVGLGAAPLVDQLDHVLDLLLHAVEVGHLAVHAVLAAFTAGAVVAGDVEDQRVVGLPGFLEGLQHAADLVVGVLGVGREDLRLAGEQALLVGRELVPVLDRRWLGRQLRSRRHDAGCDLARQGLLAHLVPALIELAFPAIDPELGHVVRRVRRAGSEVDEGGLVGRHGLLVPDPGPRLVRHVGHEMVFRVVRQFEVRDAVVDQRRPLVGLAAEETVELVEALPRRPAVERPRDADLPGRGLVPLAERGRAVAVVT